MKRKELHDRRRTQLRMSLLPQERILSNWFSASQLASWKLPQF